MNNKDVIKLPRLYVDHELAADASLSLPEAQSHYLRAVLRRQPEDRIRLFNGRQGEWLGVLETVTKKAVMVRPVEKLREQPDRLPSTHLFFAPIKKNRMDWLIEKSVELGVTHLHPVLTRNTEMRQLKEERLCQQIIEAAEQCERLDIPALSPPQTLDVMLAGRDDMLLLACLERDRQAAPVVTAIIPDRSLGILVGPEGGFTDEETALIKQAGNVVPVSLGEDILRCETACCLALGSVKLARAR